MDIPRALRTAREWDRSQKEGSSPPSKEQMEDMKSCGCPDCMNSFRHWNNGGPKGAPLFVFRTRRVIETEEAREQLVEQITSEQGWCRDHVKAGEKHIEGGGDLSRVQYTQQDNHDLANLLEVIQMVETGEEF